MKMTLRPMARQHMLHLGILAQSSVESRGWKGAGWIDIVGLLAPRFPQFVDDRRLRTDPPCVHPQGSCPFPEAFWIDIPLNVSVGQVRQSASVTVHHPGGGRLFVLVKIVCLCLGWCHQHSGWCKSRSRRRCLPTQSCCPRQLAQVHICPQHHDQQH